MDKEVTVKYLSLIKRCNCCGQKIKEPILNEGIHRFTTDNFLEYLKREEWENESKNNNLMQVIKEFVHEVISFYSFHFDEIIINNDEIKKVKDFVLREVIGQS